MTAVTVSVSDAMAISGLSYRTIYRLMASGELQSTKVGSRRLIRRDSLLKVLGATDAPA